MKFGVEVQRRKRNSSADHKRRQLRVPHASFDRSKKNECDSLMLCLGLLP